MRAAIHLAVVVAVLTLPVSAHANPCAAARVDGRNLLPGGPLPAVHLIDERIAITLETRLGGEEGGARIRRKRFDVRYVFYNRGPAQEVLLGFPVVVPVLDRDKNTAPPLAGFRVGGRGVGRRVAPDAARLVQLTERAALHFCEASALADLKQSLAASEHRGAYRFGREVVAFSYRAADEPYQVGWYFWRQRFAPGRSRLRVRYSVAADFGICAANYVLRTARSFGDGTIGRLTVDLRAVPAAARDKLSAQLTAVPGRVKGPRAARKRPRPIELRPVGRGRLRWQAAPFSATDDLSIRLAGCEEG